MKTIDELAKEVEAGFAPEAPVTDEEIREALAEANALIGANCDSCHDDVSIDCHDCEQYQQAATQQLAGIYETLPNGDSRIGRKFGVVNRHRFNGNTSSICWVFSYVNKAWFVWREDGDHQAQLRVHNDFNQASDDFFGRVNFLESVMELARQKALEVPHA